LRRAGKRAQFLFPCLCDLGELCGQLDRLPDFRSSFSTPRSALMHCPLPAALGPRRSYNSAMNKAFVREPEDTGQRHCPRCGSLAVLATVEAVREHLSAEALANISEIAWFCPFPRCEVAYFDPFERVATIEQLTQPVWPKDPDAPLCSCFGLTRDDIEQDIREGVVTRVRATVEKAKTPEARCHTLAADGHSCVGEVQRYYMKLRQSSQRS
jgi:hypothetical protein